MKQKSPSVLDFRMAINQEIDLVLGARAKALNVDKAAVARDVLAKWASSELAFIACMASEQASVEKRLENHRYRTRKALPRRLQNQVFRRDGFKCRQCDDEPGVEKLHIDHVIPLAAGGSDELTNLQVLCEPCNLSKADKVVAIK